MSDRLKCTDDDVMIEEEASYHIYRWRSHSQTNHSSSLGRHHHHYAIMTGCHGNGYGFRFFSSFLTKIRRCEFSADDERFRMTIVDYLRRAFKLHPAIPITFYSISLVAYHVSVKPHFFNKTRLGCLVFYAVNSTVNSRDLSPTVGLGFGHWI